MKLIQGNEACALGALDAGCTFYAGYPITPATEIMEWMAREMPKRGHTFIQMEDEIASIAAVIGASWSGAKSMTATSGPGFSLMQENIGYAAMTETPCVIVDCQRGGPSTGLPTLPSQGDVMQAQWGSHGDRPSIVLTASSVLTTYEMTIKAFNLSEKFRVPVVLLLDAVIAHMRENVDLPAIPVTDRKEPDRGAGFQPFGTKSFLPFGKGERKVVTGLAHGATGLPITTDGTASQQLLRKSINRLQHHMDEIVIFTDYWLESARWLIISYGITSRQAKAAVEKMRGQGIDVGLLDLQTLWPFPEELVSHLANQVEGILVPELNLGQLIWPVRAAAAGNTAILPMNKVDGQLFHPGDIERGIFTLMFKNTVANTNIHHRRN